AEKIARRLIEQRLAACVSLTPGAVSHYRWKGAIETSEEVMLTIKSRRSLFERLRAEIRRIHSYETPEILAVAVIDGDKDYLDWMEREVAWDEET
ncbi:MAG: divalent-cation tolerance protein CutA, partial [Bryobacterales bacterium]|nr:divalent-cation tolerance protein CutA [Bryobacterales bacterium]